MGVTMTARAIHNSYLLNRLVDAVSIDQADVCDTLPQVSARVAALIALGHVDDARAPRPATPSVFALSLTSLEKKKKGACSYLRY